MGISSDMGSEEDESLEWELAVLDQMPDSRLLFEMFEPDQIEALKSEASELRWVLGVEKVFWTLDRPHESNMRPFGKASLTEMGTP